MSQYRWKRCILLPLLDAQFFEFAAIFVVGGLVLGVAEFLLCYREVLAVLDPIVANRVIHLLACKPLLRAAM